MTVTPAEKQTALQRLENSLIAMTNAVGLAVPDICSYGLTIGESYVPFLPDPDEDCTEDDITCSQVWVRVESISASQNSGEGWGGNACALALNMEIEVGVLRCIELPADGEAPTASDVLTAAIQNLQDMNAILCAVTEVPPGSKPLWDSISVGSWNPTGPLGGQFGGIWNFMVEI